MRRMLFEKLGKSVWMSHLDTMRLMQRAFRRAGVLLHHSQGYTPHAYISMPLPLSVGMESVCEIMEYELDVETAITAEQMNAVLPEGVRILAVYDSALKSKHLTYLRAELILCYDRALTETEIQKLQALFAQPTLPVEKRTKRGPEDTDIRSMIREISVGGHPEGARIECMVCAQNPSLNPLLLSAAVTRHLPELSPVHCRCKRVEIYDETGNVFR